MVVLVRQAGELVLIVLLQQLGQEHHAVGVLMVVFHVVIFHLQCGGIALHGAYDLVLAGVFSFIVTQHIPGAVKVTLYVMITRLARFRACPPDCVPAVPLVERRRDALRKGKSLQYDRSFGLQKRLVATHARHPHVNISAIESIDGCGEGAVVVSVDKVGSERQVIVSVSSLCACGVFYGEVVILYAATP